MTGAQNILDLDKSQIAGLFDFQVWGRVVDKARAVIVDLSYYGIGTSVVSNLSQALKASDVIVTTTSSIAPLFEVG